jgi:hypothetical protein
LKTKKLKSHKKRKMKFPWYVLFLCIIPIALTIGFSAEISHYYNVKRFNENLIPIVCQIVDRIIIPFNCTIKYDCEVNDETGEDFNCKEREEICTNVYIILNWKDPFSFQEFNETIFILAGSNYYNSVLFVNETCTYYINSKTVSLGYWNLKDIEQRLLRTIIILACLSGSFYGFIILLCFILKFKNFFCFWK